MDYKKLQNGSDIRGVALEGIEGQHINLTEQACKDIGRGFALWLKSKAGKMICVLPLVVTPDFPVPLSAAGSVMQWLHRV